MTARSLPKKIEINADMGEAFGRWKLGPDEEIMKHIDVANVACGFHASDPVTLHKTVRLAKKHNVAVGAHPGFPDLAGFGRRRMELTEEEVADIITYQIGAVKAFCDLEGVPLNHVKPHGALYFYLKNSRPHCVAAFRAIKAWGVPVYGLGGTVHEEVAKEVGIPFVPELFVDIEYSPEGALIPPAQSKEISPEESAERARKVALTGTNYAQGGGEVHMPEFGHGDNGGRCRPFSICLHSDLPGAEQSVAATRRAVDELNAKLFGDV
ncbi:related to Lactam utilization protein lamB [Pseudozyma flocculosa]|uniref:Related to Lactam utilization protein lamB n=2 Tax=Pseudozyma flocculosa TaxID=84751 RepID=A0A5C3EYX7_9BASI|nr:related to Lactam utilization protein lamB [Pseudozyma flocculosa]